MSGSAHGASGAQPPADDEDSAVTYARTDDGKPVLGPRRCTCIEPAKPFLRIDGGVFGSLACGECRMLLGSWRCRQCGERAVTIGGLCLDHMSREALVDYTKALQERVAATPLVKRVEIPCPPAEMFAGPTIVLDEAWAMKLALAQIAKVAPDRVNPEWIVENSRRYQRIHQEWLAPDRFYRDLRLMLEERWPRLWRAIADVPEHTRPTEGGHDAARG